MSNKKKTPTENVPSDPELQKRQFADEFCLFIKQDDQSLRDRIAEILKDVPPVLTIPSQQVAISNQLQVSESLGAQDAIALLNLVIKYFPVQAPLAALPQAGTADEIASHQQRPISIRVYQVPFTASVKSPTETQYEMEMVSLTQITLEPQDMVYETPLAAGETRLDGNLRALRELMQKFTMLAYEAQADMRANKLQRTGDIPSSGDLLPQDYDDPL